MGIIDAGEGDTHMRAVGVNEPAAGLTWMWAGARPATAAGAGRRNSQPCVTSQADVRLPLYA